MDIEVSQLQLNAVCLPLEVAACISIADIETSTSVTFGLCSDYDDSPPLQRSPDESNR